MYPKVNQKIIIDFKSKDQTYKSVVAEVSDKEILIGVPVDNSVIDLVLAQEKLEITFVENDVKYKFETEIIGRKQDNMPLFRISKPEEDEIVKIQLRENFRVPANLPLKVEKTTLTTVNLSAGGVLMSCMVELDLHEGEEISGTILLPGLQNKESESIDFVGEIKRINWIENQDRKNVAIEFKQMDKRDQSKIIQYCFEKQRQNRLKARN
ncbi:flagellar brake protein [Neobacillus sp. LXY-1]|uniref:flagellar brake protein n=1 Tax=Neobacillus sp. LXY-1 TaxID=3379133 RepID=UPI003EE2AC14